MFAQFVQPLYLSNYTLCVGHYKMIAYVQLKEKYNIVLHVTVL